MTPWPSRGIRSVSSSPSRIFRGWITASAAFSAVTLNEMAEKGSPPESVGAYLVGETAIYSSVISENSTGIYSYYKGTYLDGSGWEPPAGYEPKERPWYTAALAGKGSIVLTKPFLNLQTNTMMMSVSCLLDDGESVVSMDIFLDSVQRMVEEISTAEPVAASFVMDRSGFVVAHSNPEAVGRNCAQDGRYLERELLEKVRQAGSRQDWESLSFELVDENNARYVVFAQSVNKDWQIVYVLNQELLYQSLSSIYYMSTMVLLLVLGLILLFFFFMYRKQAEAELLSNEMQAMADIYVAFLKIDLKDDTFDCMQGTPALEKLIAGDFTCYSQRVAALVGQLTAEKFRDLVMKFVSTDTLEERLQGMKSISLEFLDVSGKWIRIRYVVIDRDEEGKIWHLLLAFESIDEDRKQQEKLRHLSETDLMTGIKNRGCGEMLIRNAVLERKSGMFCLMDVDSFKSINDSYGHAIGDKVIVAIADCMKKVFRDSDIVFRLGGDEFAVFADGVNDRQVGERIIRRFFACVEQISIPELMDRKITVSLGATFYPAGLADSFEALYQRADEGTYESKKQVMPCRSI